MSTSTETFTYGNSRQFTFETLQAGVPITEATVSLDRVQIDPDDYHNALADINRSFRILEDPVTGKTFETAVANLDATDDTVDAEISTFNSSISNNVGNAAEFALHAATHPGRRRVYIASPGNGASSHLDSSERRQARKTGSFIGRNGQVMPTMAALARVLQRADLPVSRLATDSAGGAYATALMPALPEGRVTHAYLKSRPSIMEQPHRFAWAARFFIGENLDSLRYKEFTKDPWDLTEGRLAEARSALPSIYDLASDGVWTNLGALNDGGIAKLWAHMETICRAGAAHDTAYALRAQPELNLTHHLPIGDRSYGPNIRSGVMRYLGQTIQEAVRIGSNTPRLGSKDSQASLEVAIMPGTHHDHSQYPTLRQTVETYAFSK